MIFFTGSRCRISFCDPGAAQDTGESIIPFVAGLLKDRAGTAAIKLLYVCRQNWAIIQWYDAGVLGSGILIQQGAAWGNWVVGATDEGHRALSINPTTLQLDDSVSGVVLEPKHLQQAMRQLADVDQSSIARQFPLNAEFVDFFG